MYRSLVALAGSAAQVPGYCAGLPPKASGTSAHPGQGQDRSSQPERPAAKGSKDTGASRKAGSSHGNGTGTGKAHGNGTGTGTGTRRPGQEPPNRS